MMNPTQPHSLRLARPALLAALLLAGIPGVRAADETPALDSLLGMDIASLGGLKVSTASRHPELYARSPGTLLVVTRQQIRERGYRSLAELLADMPSVDVQNLSDGSTSNRIALRGVIGNNKLLILQDGIRISSPTGDPIAVMDNFPLYHVRQVEVVYGPASALYGADAFTGVVNLITDTDPASGSELALEGGSFDHRYFHFNTVKPLGDDLRLQAGGHWRRDDNANLAEYHPDSFVNLRPGDRFDQPSSSNSFNARLDWNDRVSLGWNHSRYQAATSIGAQPQAVDYSSGAEYITLLDTVWGEWRWHHDEQLSGKVTLDWSRHEVDPASEFVNSYTGFTHTGYKYSLNERWRIEPEVTWQRDGHHLIGGISLEWLDALPKTANLPYPYDQGGPFYYPGTDDQLEIEIFRKSYRNLGAYLQYTGEVGERTLVHLGARYDDNSVYGTSLTPRLGVNFTVSPGTVLKYLYGEAFLAPSPFFAYENYGSFTGETDSDGRYTSWFFQVPNADLRPERLKSHELRLVHAPSADLEVNAGLYHIAAKDIIYRLPTTTPISDFARGGDIYWTTINTNVGQLESIGIDIGFDYTFRGQGWKTRFFGNAGYVDGELSGLATTVPLPFVSRAKANLGLTWTLANTWQVTPRMRWVGVAQGPADNGHSHISGYTVFDLYARWMEVTDKTDLFLRIDNLFDRRYYNVGDSGGSGFTETPQEPRRIWLGLIFNF